MAATAKIVKVDAERPQTEVVHEAAELIRHGGVIGYPTETAYGLGADAMNGDARERIFAMKGRGHDKVLPIIVADLDQLDSLCHPIPDTVRVLAEHFWPGPLTLVVPLRNELRQGFGGGTSIAVRVSGLALARELARASGCGLTATSANRSGGEPARNASEVWATLGDALDLVLDGGEVSRLAPSTIVDLMGETPRLLRAGPVLFDEILQALRSEAAP
ncbi:MAG: L-threonylcarbamoyladenylate synthase [Vicinamibacteria bacterium]